MGFIGGFSAELSVLSVGFRGRFSVGFSVVTSLFQNGGLGGFK